MRRIPAFAVFLFAFAFAGSASATPFTTVQRTIQDCDGDNLLDSAPGEEHVPFTEPPPSEPEDPCRDGSRGGRTLRLPPSASIVNFLQLSDFQIVDEESPARVEWLDATQRIPRLQPFSAAYRPQESLTTQITEAMVRQARNTVSPVTAERLDLAILTGDNADSQQFNETRWFIDILDGTVGGETPYPDPEPAASRDRKIDPNSGIPAPGCEATPGTLYDGVRDSGRSGLFPDGGYYEPDSSSGERDDGDGYSPFRAENVEETPGRDVTVRDFPGLFENANEPFEAVGLGLPWYSAFGNHDALIQGNSPDAYAGPLGPGPAPAPEATEVFNPGFHAIATGCVKVRQPAAGTTAAIGPLVEQIRSLGDGGLTPPEQEQADELTGQVLGLAQDAILDPCDPATEEGCEVDVVPPDPRRCFLAKDEPSTSAPGSPCETGGFIQQHFLTTGSPVGHGFAPAPELPPGKQGGFCDAEPADPDCLAASYGRPPEAERNADGYYSFSPKPGLRFAVLDTVTDECGSLFCSEGSVDDTQFEWLRRQIATAAANGEYVLVFSHHTLRTIRFPSIDVTELPVHFGMRVDRRSPGNPQSPSPAQTLEELYCQHPNVLAHVAGHEHANYVERLDCADDEPPPLPTCAAAASCPNPHFWHISTAAHIDWPSQARMIELVEVDGEMSFVLTMLDHLGGAKPGGRDEQADSGHAPDDIARLASIGREIAYNDYQGDRGARGTRIDRNVILPTDRPPPLFAAAP
jgi:3',5'-cyclic AMP phosphodiesterase CpdA